jgi:hypothetical protein
MENSSQSEHEFSSALVVIERALLQEGLPTNFSELESTGEGLLERCTVWKLSSGGRELSHYQKCSTEAVWNKPVSLLVPSTSAVSRTQS